MKTKILYADDEAEWRRMVGIFLKLAGFEVLAAQNATEAMQLAESEPVGAVILDVNLAGEDGAGLLGFLKANGPDIPVILYTGLDHDAAAIQQLLARGADQYLRKGHLRDLIKCVEDILRIRNPATMHVQRPRPRLQTSAWQIV